LIPRHTEPTARTPVRVLKARDEEWGSKFLSIRKCLRILGVVSYAGG